MSLYPPLLPLLCPCIHRFFLLYRIQRHKRYSVIVLDKVHNVHWRVRSDNLSRISFWEQVLEKLHTSFQARLIRSLLFAYTPSPNVANAKQWTFQTTWKDDLHIHSCQSIDLVFIITKPFYMINFAGFKCAQICKVWLSNYSIAHNVSWLKSLWHLLHLNHNHLLSRFSGRFHRRSIRRGSKYKMQHRSPTELSKVK